VLEGLEDRVLMAGNPTAYTVNLLSDNGTGSGQAGDIAYVLSHANADTNPAGSLIQFDPTVFATRQTIPLTSTLELSGTAGPIVIQGPATNNVVIDGNGNVGDFMVDTGVTANLSHLVITNGNNGGDGGGISSDGTLTVADCVLSGNSTAHDGGGIANTHTLTVTDSVLTGNTAAGNGGGLSNTGTLAVTGTQITNNTSSNDAGGLLSRMGTAQVTDTLIASNTAGTDGGGISNTGPSQLSLSNTTVADNSSLNGGGVMNEGSLKAVNVTIADNTAGAGGAGVPGNGGGLYNDGGSATLDNSIVALNLNVSNSPAAPDDVPLAVSPASAFNLIGTGGSGGLTNGTNGNQVGVSNPGLSPLGDNGGGFPSIALMPGSPAIDKGSNALAVDPATGQPLTTDQRGAGFGRIHNGTVDIGAYESGAGASPVQVLATPVRIKGHSAVRVTDPATGAVKFTIVPFGKGYRGRILVSMADVNGDGVQDLIVRRPRGHKQFLTKVFNGLDGTPLPANVS
jgi:hypothetical protein